MGHQLQGRLVLITGASTGIGRATSTALVEEGARVLGLARSFDRLDELSRGLGGAEKFVAIEADVTDADRMRAVVRTVLSDHGVPDVIIANAGISLDALFANTSDEALTRVLEVNVVGLVRSVRPFVPAMIERGSGRIVLISSIVGKRGVPYYAAYSASKFALHGIADALRTELYGSGVTVGLVCPSTTESELHERALREGPSQRRVRLRSHSAESVARAIVKMAASRRRETVLSAEAKLMALANVVAPGLVDRLLARILRSRAAD